MTDYLVSVTTTRTCVRVDESPRVASASWLRLDVLAIASMHTPTTYPVPYTR
jgi:hypothetical protein